MLENADSPVKICPNRPTSKASEGPLGRALQDVHVLADGTIGFSGCVICQRDNPEDFAGFRAQFVVHSGLDVLAGIPKLNLFPV